MTYQQRDKIHCRIMGTLCTLVALMASWVLIITFA